MNNSLYLSKKSHVLITWLSMFVGILLTLLILGGSRAGALPGDATNILPSDPGRWLIVTRPGTNGMNAGSMQGYAYVPQSAGSSFRMTLVSACDAGPEDEDPNGYNTVFSFPRTDVSNVTVVTGDATRLIAPHGLSSDDHWIICNSGSNVVVDVTLNGNPSPVVINGITYRRIIMRATVGTSLSGYYANRFRFSTPSTNGVLFGFESSATQPGSSDGYTGIAFNNQSSGWGWSTQLSFAEPCGGSAQSRRVWFWDTDHSGSSTSSSPFWQNTSSGRWMSYRIESYNRYTDALINSNYASGTLNAGNNVPDATNPFPTNPDHKYRIIVYNINYVNSIQIALPVEQIFANDRCDEINASCSFINTPATVNVGQSFSAQVRVNNLSSSSGNISGSANAVTTSRQSGPGTTGLPTTNNSYAAVGPGGSRSLPAVSVTANGAGTLVIRAAVANTDNNASCTRSITVNNVENASCAFINTPTTATVGQSFTVQVRVTNASGSTANIRGSTHPVNTVRVSGPGVSGLPSNNNSYAAISPGASGNLPALSVTANATGTLLIRATIANTDNNALCTRSITVSFAPPEVHCEIAPLGFIQLGQTNVPMQVTAWFTDAPGPGSSVNTGSIVDASATVGSTAATRTTGMPINNVTKGVTGARTINFQFNAPAAGSSTVTASVVMSFPNTPGGNITENCPQSAVVVGNMPYMKVFGGDIHAGGQFVNVNPSCSVPAGTGGVYGFAEQVSGNNYRGASAQLSISSLLTVNEFYSASQRGPGGNTIQPRGLTIANNSGTYGGNSTWDKCIYNFFEDTRENIDVTEINGTPPANIAANQGLIRYVPSGSTLNINGLNVGVGTQVAIYVDGNVNIRGNITVGSDRSGVTDINDLPYLAIIARGNIYVENDVTRIDGLYIAQPANNGSNGKFYTCTNPGGVPYVLNQIYTDCRTPLRINGSIVARQIRFGRSNGTLNSAVTREYPNIANEAGFDNVAEVFVYTPEMWMAPSPLSIPNASNLTPETVKWQAATSLPPVF